MKGDKVPNGFYLYVVSALAGLILALINGGVL